MIKKGYKYTCDICGRESDWSEVSEEPKAIKNGFLTLDINIVTYNHGDSAKNYCSIDCVKKHLDDIYTN